MSNVDHLRWDAGVMLAPQWHGDDHKFIYTPSYLRLFLYCFAYLKMQATMQPCAAHSGQINRRPFASAYFCKTPTAAAPSVCAQAQSTGCCLRTAQSGAAALRCGRTAGRATRQRVAAISAEISYVMIKPDGVQRALVGEVRPRSLP